MKNAEIYIGIDPDTVKSGFAVWIPESKSLKIQALSFFEIFNNLKYFEMTDANILVRIEAGWLNKKSNFHSSAYQTKASGERIAKNVGANHEVGKKLGEMCTYLGIDFEFVYPQGKVTPEYFKQLTGIDVKKSEQDKIDAGMLVFAL